MVMVYLADKSVGTPSRGSQIVQFFCCYGSIENRDLIQAAFPIGDVIAPAAEEELVE